MENFRLRVFRTVARTLSFRQAAEELFLTQPAVSQQVKALEEELATPLFTRAGGRVSLTPAGAVLQDFANRLGILADQAAQAVAEIAATSFDELRIGASQTIGQYLLPALLARLLESRPGCPIQSLGGNTEEVLLALTAQRIDLALIEGPALHAGIHSQPFLTDRMVLVVPPGHDWATREVSLDDLAAEPFVSREVGSGSRRIIETALDAAGLPPRQLRTILTLDSTEGLLSAVEAGLGVAFVSRWAVRNQLALGTLRTVHLHGLSISRVFSAAYRTGPAPTGSAGAFLRLLLADARTLSPRRRASKSPAPPLAHHPPRPPDNPR